MAMKSFKLKYHIRPEVRNAIPIREEEIYTSNSIKINELGERVYKLIEENGFESIVIEPCRALIK